MNRSHETIVLVSPDRLPERWKSRARVLYWVSLLPGEDILDGQSSPEHRFDNEEGELARLVAEGLSNYAIARALGTSPRTVGRRLLRLQGKLGVNTKGELVAALSAAGFRS